MICEPCKDGGKLNVGGFYELAVAMHQMCHSPNCPCQHRVGYDYINKEALGK